MVFDRRRFMGMAAAAAFACIQLSPANALGASTLDAAVSTIGPDRMMNLIIASMGHGTDDEMWASRLKHVITPGLMTAYERGVKGLDDLNAAITIDNYLVSREDGLLRFGTRRAVTEALQSVPGYRLYGGGVAVHTFHTQFEYAAWMARDALNMLAVGGDSISCQVLQGNVEWESLRYQRSKGRYPISHDMTEQTIAILRNEI